MQDELPDFTDLCGAQRLEDCFCGDDPNGGDGMDD